MLIQTKEQCKKQSTKSRSCNEIKHRFIIYAGCGGCGGCGCGGCGCGGCGGCGCGGCGCGGCGGCGCGGCGCGGCGGCGCGGHCGAHCGGHCGSGGDQKSPNRSKPGILPRIFPGLFPGKKKKGSKASIVTDPITNLFTRSFDIPAPFYMANTTYYDQNGCLQYAGATGATEEEAQKKAIIEGFERWSSAQVHTDYYGTGTDLIKHKQNIIGLDKIAPMTDLQALSAGLVPYRKNLPISWTKGTRLKDKSEVFVPSDYVYYGQISETNRVYYGHSSGIAAYTNRKEALKRAIVELIERDAIMRNWYTRTAPNRISYEALPTYAKERTDFWAKHQTEVYILELPSQYGRVIEAITVRDTYPCFVSGAAATIDAGQEAYEETVIKALQEAECNLMICMQHPSHPIVELEQVFSPMQHAQVYYSKENAKSLSWLWSGVEVKKPKTFKGREVSKLIDQLDIVSVDLTPTDSPIKVIRAISTKLVSINFGYYTAHYTHPSVKKEATLASVTMPHYFA